MLNISALYIYKLRLPFQGTYEVTCLFTSLLLSVLFPDLFASHLFSLPLPLPLPLCLGVCANRCLCNTCSWSLCACSRRWRRRHVGPSRQRRSRWVTESLFFVVLFRELGTGTRVAGIGQFKLKASCVQVKQICVYKNVEAVIRAWCVCTGRRWTVLHYISNGLRMVLLLLLWWWKTMLLLIVWWYVLWRSCLGFLFWVILVSVWVCSPTGAVFSFSSRSCRNHCIVFASFVHSYSRSLSCSNVVFLLSLSISPPFKTPLHPQKAAPVQQLLPV